MHEAKEAKIWLRSYPKGVPADIDPAIFSSLPDLFQWSCERYQQLPAFTHFGKTLTFKELKEKVQQFASFLQQQLHLQPGDRIALMMPNMLQYPIALWGALQAGLVVVNVNPLYTAKELEFQMHNSGAKAIVVLSNFAHTVEEALSQTSLAHIIVTDIGDCLSPMKRHFLYFMLKFIYRKIPKWHFKKYYFFRDCLNCGKNKLFKPVELKSEDLAFLQYTGGTTGISKGAMLTHGNIISNTEQILAWVSPVLVEGKEIVMTALPLYHIFSLTANMVLFVRTGGHNILIANPRDISGLIKILRRTPFTVMTGVNTLFRHLLTHPYFKKCDFNTLKVTIGGGMAVQKYVAEQWKKITGVPLIEGYGLTETSPVVCANPIDTDIFTGTTGLPLPSTQVQIIDDTEKPVALGEEGELVVKGPQVMKGYWQSALETAGVFTQDGWLRTGDIASMDARGFIRILERKKDMILVSGFKVYPNEVEDAIADLAGVREVAVIGVSDEDTGEIVKAFIVTDDADITKDVIIAHCRKQLTSYKIPKIVEFCENLPKTTVGKILRRALR